ncbi:helix-turn-helix transcriptional regulator [Parahaliea maris]|uniref:helix-turn-helix transcriptional regulator n=1 Tax=Parahaliea maris TaxID=2716870 RepID=UPI00165004C9|nr:AraC family transcriptional regulator [Parahaliea maris]
MSISLPVTWCALPSPLHDEVTYRLNTLRCREIIASREQGGSTTWAVSNMLSNHFDQLIRREKPPGPPPTLAGIAADMHMTERTLIRRLRAEGTSYREIMEQQRRELAGALLGNAGLRVAEVGELLGYREPANFGRAFRRWHGCSPARWRRDN